MDAACNLGMGKWRRPYLIHYCPARGYCCFRKTGTGMTEFAFKLHAGK